MRTARGRKGSIIPAISARKVSTRMWDALISVDSRRSQRPRAQPRPRYARRYRQNAVATGRCAGHSDGKLVSTDVNWLDRSSKKLRRETAAGIGRDPPYGPLEM